MPASLEKSHRPFSSGDLLLHRQTIHCVGPHQIGIELKRCHGLDIDNAVVYLIHWGLAAFACRGGLVRFF